MAFIFNKASLNVVWYETMNVTLSLEYNCGCLYTKYKKYILHVFMHLYTGLELIYSAAIVLNIIEKNGI